MVADSPLTNSTSRTLWHDNVKPRCEVTTIKTHLLGNCKSHKGFEILLSANAYLICKRQEVK